MVNQYTHFWLTILSGHVSSPPTNRSSAKRKRFSGLSLLGLLPNLDVMITANESIMQQKLAMAETLRQLEHAAEVGVQSDAAAARMALANAEQIMFQENAK